MAVMAFSALRTEGRICPLGLDAEAPLFSWSFAAAAEPSLKQAAYRVAVATSEKKLLAGEADAWDSGVVQGGAHTSVAYRGAALEPGRRYFWRVAAWDEQGRRSDSPVAWWETGRLSETDWTGRWIGAPEPRAEGRPLPQFRRAFAVKGPVSRARIYISGLGHYELRLNGSKVGDSELDPGWTDYDKTVLYAVHDVTELLRQGENVAGVWLGNGFYHVDGGRYAKFKDSYGAPKLRADIVIGYADGTAETIGTDRTWRASPGPLTFSCIYGGEDYDARLVTAGWDRPGFSEGSGWAEAAEVAAPSGRLVAQSAPPLKAMLSFTPAVVATPKPGVHVFDLGQNFSGWPEIETSGARGTAIKLVPAELLSEDGLADQRWTGAPYELNYALKGEGVEAWRPRFTYYGFRYVQAEGAALASEAGEGPKNLPVLHRLRGRMIVPDTPATGGFRCSDELLNRIHEIIVWAMLSNMKSVFTDCPHREKLGWLEQVHLMGPSLMFNFDVEALMAKTLDDIADAQLPNGLVPTTAPEYVVFEEPWQMFREAAAWGGAYILAAWEMLQRYGNRGVLERHYDGFKRYFDYLTANADGCIVREGLGDWYDIGPKGPGFSQNTPVPLAETAIYYGLAAALRNIASLLGRENDAKTYGRLADAVKEAFNREFFDPDTQLYAKGSDAAHAMPLAIGLVPEEHREAVFARLVQNIENRGGRTTSGDVGHRYVLLALSRGGRSDIVFRMTRDTGEPGYGYQIAHGATTLTEAWDGPTVGKSQNHFMLGHLEEWLYSRLAGLDYRFRPETGRFEVIVRPETVGELDWAEAWCELRAGRASVRWERGKGGALALRAEIPVNAEATIYVPAKSAADVSGGEGAKPLGFADGFAAFRAGSGVYDFASVV
ncbi:MULTISPECIES: family 78 glycoside hydrolase catalytic domain [Cohnella]|uniref:family 78 glycoside hydrolase catalytic domain n=1 Tax=Cohnella TaxID=329857 RepID=UPI0009B991F3|nr:MULTISPECIES: family 78 glycoside hydrolase catalytic domain [Cohnella]MBN2982473.1 family 78 glycoside hydrolase catalytic domain [Cohnella algarum]